MNEAISETNNDCVTHFWKHDKDDDQLDSDLLEMMGNQQLKAKNIRIRSKTTKLNEETSINEWNQLKKDNDFRPKPISGANSPLRSGANSPERLGPKKTLQLLKHKEINDAEEMNNSPLYSRNQVPIPQEFTNERKVAPNFFSQSNDNQKPLRHLFTKKPSFNAGYQSPIPEHFSDPKDHLKIADIVENRMLKPRQPTLPTIIPHHPRTQSHAQLLLLPLNKESDSPTLIKDHMEGRNSDSPYKRGFRDQKTPIRSDGHRGTWADLPSSNSNLASHKEQVGSLNEASTKITDTGSYTHLREENGGHVWTSAQPKTHFLQGNGSDSVLKSLIRLPRLSNKASSNEMSSLASPALLENNNSPSRPRPVRDSFSQFTVQQYENSNSPSRPRLGRDSFSQFAGQYVPDRKLTLFVANAPPSDNSVFKAAASRQLQGYVVHND